MDERRRGGKPQFLRQYLDRGVVVYRQITLKPPAVDVFEHRTPRVTAEDPREVGAAAPAPLRQKVDAAVAPALDVDILLRAVDQQPVAGFRAARFVLERLPVKTYQPHRQQIDEQRDLRQHLGNAPEPFRPVQRRDELFVRTGRKAVLPVEDHVAPYALVVDHEQVELDEVRQKQYPQVAAVRDHIGIIRLVRDPRRHDDRGVGAAAVELVADHVLALAVENQQYLAHVGVRMKEPPLPILIRGGAHPNGRIDVKRRADLQRPLLQKIVFKYLPHSRSPAEIARQTNFARFVKLLFRFVNRSLLHGSRFRL